MNETVLCILTGEPEVPAWNEERAHLVIEDDDGWPYLSGCDCELARDHYLGQKS